MSELYTHPLYNATRRLATALDRLENNLKQVTIVMDRDVLQEHKITAFEHENNALKKQGEQLNASITQLQCQYNDLHKAASTIYGKLNDSIRRLSLIIDE